MNVNAVKACASGETGPGLAETNYPGKEGRIGAVSLSPGELQTSEARAEKNSSSHENGNFRILDDIKNGLSPRSLGAHVEYDLQDSKVQRVLVDEFSPYSENVTPFIRNTKELAVYASLDLSESRVLDRPCLQMKIDPDRTDAMGRTNADRIKEGRAPIDDNGDAVNLHHVGQREYSPLAELPDRTHKEFDSVLHDKTVTTEVHGDGNNWNEQRANYWRERYLTL